MRETSNFAGFIGNFLVPAVAAASLLLGGADAMANSVTQNTSWTIDRPNSTTTYRIVAYGDSIFAGYNGSISSVDKRAITWVQGEYLSNLWGTDIDVTRRTKSGAKADDIYNNKIVAERSYMQATNTRVVTFEMCGNDFLQARDSFSGQTGACDFSVFDSALATCTTYVEAAMTYINANAYSGVKKKMVMNLYYPGYDADNMSPSCTGPATGARINKQGVMFPYLARSNYRTCKLAAQYGFDCVDAFAEYMGADYDSNGDGQIDAVALRYIPGETENAYVNRITITLRSTVRDSNAKLVSSGTSYDFILSDNTHPTYSGGTIYVGLIGGTGTGSGAPDYSGAQIVNGKNPIWTQFGHERAGWLHSLLNPATP